MGSAAQHAAVADKEGAARCVDQPGVLVCAVQGASHGACYCSKRRQVAESGVPVSFRGLLAPGC